MIKVSTLVMALFGLFALLFPIDSFAAPALRPLDKCDACLKASDDCYYASRRRFAECFVESGSISAAQHYCINNIIDWYFVEPMDLQTLNSIIELIYLCEIEHNVEPGSGAQLELSLERYNACSKAFVWDLELCRPKDGCRRVCPHIKPLELGNPAL